MYARTSIHFSAIVVTRSGDIEGDREGGIGKIKLPQIATDTTVYIQLLHVAVHISRAVIRTYARAHGPCPLPADMERQIHF